jgi:Tol biopolymer transport system component
MGVDLVSGELIDYSRDWAYDEAEGIFPDGRSIAVERELDTYTAVPVGDLDIWQLSLDGSGASRRLTYFSEYAGYGANNPVNSPDGRKMAFALRVKGGEHGNAQGIFLYDLEQAPSSP